MDLCGGSTTTYDPAARERSIFTAPGWKSQTLVSTGYANSDIWRRARPFPRTPATIHQPACHIYTGPLPPTTTSPTLPSHDLIIHSFSMLDTSQPSLPD